MKIKQNSGFTIIELVATISLLSILIVIGMPSWSPTIRENSISKSVNQVQGIYKLARSEALKRGKDVDLVSTNNGQTWNLTIKGTSEKLKTINLTNNNISIAPTDKDKTETSITINSSGFAESAKLKFNWEDENRYLTIFPSGQSTTSETNS